MMNRILFSYKNSIQTLGIAILLFIASTNISMAQGPNAPEAASFEPVDATDMVNLLTGDFTYVLPLLNVPSPEGGYPLALSYHAGIAMDQEASWVGLGWNVNPGAINRGVNGYPDDYDGSLLSEYFYDEGGEEFIYTISTGYSYGVSVGTTISWGSNRSLSGSVSIGYGVPVGDGQLGVSASIGTESSSLGLGYTSASGLSVGASISTNGTVGGSVGFNSNGSGFSLGASSNGNYSLGFEAGNVNGKSFSMDVNFSSSGAGISGGISKKRNNRSIGGAGVGLSLAFNNASSMNNYSTKSGGFLIPIVVPTPVGIFSFSFGKQKFKYYLGNKEKNYVSGPLYFKNGVASRGRWRVLCRSLVVYDPDDDDYELCEDRIIYGQQQALDHANVLENDPHDCSCSVTPLEIDEAFMDIYEVPFGLNISSDGITVDINNLAFPSYDKYNVQAQGLSGNMSSRLFENGNLFSLSNKENEDFELSYPLSGTTNNIPEHAVFDTAPHFYFDNEISSYIGVSSANFNDIDAHSNILDYYDNGVEPYAQARSENSSYVEYFTNDEIVNDYLLLKSKGYLKPNIGVSSLDHSLKPPEGIGAFKITGADGKTYHYAIPVYNHEMVTRTYGIVKKEVSNESVPKEESESYLEKRQLEPYATHWLLTAVTGPDYLDSNNDGMANEGDLGYWTNFEYGKWSDAFAWKNPYKKDYIESEENPGVKTWIRGRKEVYYLNAIKTRTHTAIFVKSESQLEQSEEWIYSSVTHTNGLEQNSSDYVENRFTIPAQNQLKLDKIILLKNEDASGLTSNGSGDPPSEQVTVKYNNSNKLEEEATINAYENIYNDSDIDSELIFKALKIIDFNYGELVNGNPKTALQKVHFYGKTGMSVIPPYQFGYNENSYAYIFDIQDKDNWGYHKDDNSYWSLNEIQTPQGAKIIVDYETHRSISVVDHKFSYTNYSRGKNTSTYPTYSHINDVSNKTVQIHSPLISLDVGDKVDINYDGVYPPLEVQGELTGVSSSYHDTGTITSDLGNDNYEVSFDNDIDIWYEGSATSIPLIESYFEIEERWHIHEKFYRGTKVTYNTNGEVLDGGGIRVKSISVENGTNSFQTEYSYGENENGIGYVSYLPYAPEVENEMPYSSELPSARVMYEYVTTKSKAGGVEVQGKTQYKFNILKEKSPYTAKFGDFYEIKRTHENNNNYFINNTTRNKWVFTSDYTVHDNLAAIGQLLEVANYNLQGQVLNKVVNAYYELGETPENYGITKESYQTYKEIDYVSPTRPDRWLISSSSRIKYPNLLKSITEMRGGHQFNSSFENLDPIIGQHLETLTYQSDGSAIKSRTVPAYTKYSQMGSKVKDISNKNMLTQQAASYSYLWDKPTTNWKTAGVGITTWNNDWTYKNVDGTQSTPMAENEKIWRKHKTYAWKGDLDTDGTLLNFNDNFNWTLGATQSPEWQKTSETTLYDHYSLPLEIEDINGNRAATIMGDKDSKIMAVGNAGYDEIAHTNCEYREGNNSSYFSKSISGGVYQTPAKAHTGKYSLRLEVHQEVPITIGTLKPINAAKKLSVWVHKDSYTNAKIKFSSGGNKEDFNGEIIPAGDWIQMNHYFTNNTTQTIYLASNGNPVYYDDIRVHPVASSMTSYVYNQHDELTHILDGNNLGTEFVYDDAGRLCKTYSEVVDDVGVTGGFKPITKNNQHYKGMAFGSFCSRMLASIAVQDAPIGQNVNETFAINASHENDTIAFWEIDYGDGMTEAGTGVPPSVVNHTYTSNSSKIMSLTITDSLGETITVTQVIVPALEVYFDNVSSSLPDPTTGILHGIPFSTITYEVSTTAENVQPGESPETFNRRGTAHVGNNPQASSTPTSTITRSIIIPESGWVNCSIKHYFDSVTCNQSYCGGSSHIRIISATQGGYSTNTSLSDSHLY